MKKFFEEFKKFITRGNIIDMSVGVIVGGAFTSIVNALSNNILKPLINWILALILGSDSLSGIYTYLTKVTVKDEITGEEVVDLAQSIYIDWGAFVNAIINFLIIAFVLFSIVKFINALSDQKAKMSDMKTKIERKQAKGKKLNKKELAFLEEEAKRLAEEEQKKLELEEAEKNKVTTESLLSEIRDLLKNR